MFNYRDNAQEIEEICIKMDKNLTIDFDNPDTKSYASMLELLVKWMKMLNAQRMKIMSSEFNLVKKMGSGDRINYYKSDTHKTLMIESQGYFADYEIANKYFEYCLEALHEGINQ